MKRLLQILGILLGLFLLILVGLNLYLTDDRLRSWVLPPVQETLNREVQLDRISYTFFRTFPRFGLILEGFELPGSVDEEPVASFDALTVSVKLFPLLRDRLEITELELTRPEITYRVYEDSTTNIDSLMPEGGETETEPESGSGTDTPFQIEIPRIGITDATLHYHDATSGMRATMDGMTTDIGLSYGEEIQTRMELNLESISAWSGEETLVENLSLRIEQRSRLHLAEERFLLEESQLSIRNFTLQLDGQFRNWSTDAPELDLAFRSASDQVGELLGLLPPSMQENLQGVQSDGAFTLEGWVRGPLVDGEIPPFDLTATIVDGSLQHPDLDAPVEQIQLDLRATPEQVTITEFQAQALENRIRAEAVIERPLSEDAPFSFSMESDADLSTIHRFYPLSDSGVDRLEGMLSLQASGEGRLDDPESTRFETRFTLQGGALQLADIPDPIEEIEADVEANQDRVLLHNSSLRLGGNQLRIAGEITQPMADEPDMDLTIEGLGVLSEIHRYVSLEPWVNELNGTARLDLRLNGPVHDPTGIALNGSMNLSDVAIQGDSLFLPVTGLHGELLASPEQLDLTEFEMNYGRSDFSIQGTVDRYMGILEEHDQLSTMPAIQGSYHSRLLDMDEMIDWEAESEEEEIWIELPSMTADVDARIDSLIIFETEITDIQGSGRLRPDQIQIDGATARLLGGSARGDLSWDVPQPDRTRIRFDGGLDALQADAFFREFPMFGENSRLEQYVTGAFSAQVNYDTELDAFVQPDITTTRANGNFGMTQARLEGHPIQDRLATWLGADEFRSMALDEWTALFAIEDTVLTLENFSLTSGNIGVELNGTQHLVNDEIDFVVELFLPSRFRAGLASVLSSRVVDALQREDGIIVVPLRMTGTMERPTITPRQTVIEDLLRDTVRDQGEQLLRGLFR
ncbi:MAG: AsmA-like C-terminal region-containing protein [Balneolaceae bacterium]